MVFDEVIYGIVSTFNAFVFLKRESPGILYMSRMIPINSITPTIMKLLYFFSYLCAHDPIPHPETNVEGKPITLKTTKPPASATPKVPNPNNTVTPRTTLLPVEDFAPTPRRSPRCHDTSPVRSHDTASLYFDVTAYLGCKGWRGTLSTGRTVFAKLWDGWKFSPEYCEHEASVYFQLRDLWGTIVPEFIGVGDWGFCHILLLSYVEV